MFHCLTACLCNYFMACRCFMAPDEHKFYMYFITDCKTGAVGCHKYSTHCAHHHSNTGDDNYLIVMIIVAITTAYVKMCAWHKHSMRCAHADHIVAVYQGGGLCDLENLRTLCVICHQVTFTLHSCRSVHNCSVNASVHTLLCECIAATRAQTIFKNERTLCLTASAASAVWSPCSCCRFKWEDVLCKAVMQQTGSRTAGMVA